MSESNNILKPSKTHNNRRPWNWLIYDINDKFLNKYSKYYKGNMYDFGCGARTYEGFFLNFADRYVGIDWGSSVHELKADILADLNKPLPIESNCADTIISLSVMEHLCEPQTMLNEAYRIMKPGARIIMQVPWQWWVHEAPYDFFRYSPYALKYMFEKAGFKNIEVEATGGFFTTWLIKMNYFTLRLITGPRIWRGVKKAIFLPFWYLGQLLAPTLDKLDKSWDKESVGYFVVAIKN